MDELLQQFLIESRELVDQATDDLLMLEKTPSDVERFDNAFRAFHTLKGGAWHCRVRRHGRGHARRGKRANGSSQSFSAGIYGRRQQLPDVSRSSGGMARHNSEHGRPTARCQRDHDHRASRRRHGETRANGGV